MKYIYEFYLFEYVKLGLFIIIIDNFTIKYISIYRSNKAYL